MRRLFQRPDTVFLIFSLVFGFLFLVIIPPFAVGDEKNHFQRLATIAFGHILNEKAIVPAGIVAFIKLGTTFFIRFLLEGHLYTSEQYHALAAIPLGAESTAQIDPNYITVHNPVCYIPQLIAFRAGVAFNATPLTLLYLARVANLLASTWLTWLAIRRMPSHQYGMCALALLPTITLFRSHLNADGITIGIAFLFIAHALRAITTAGKIRIPDILRLALLALVLAQCKSTYFVLLALVFLIPAERFASRTSRALTLCAIAIPGVTLGIVWMLIMKYTYFAGVSYHTWGGDVYPDKQSAFMLSHPFTFIKILLTTLFLTPLLPQCIIEILGDFTWQTYLPKAGYVIIVALFFITLAQDTTATNALYAKRLRWLVLFIFAGFLVITLPIFYVQWTGVGESTIKGFQGRYLIPLLPVLLLFARPLDKPLLLPASFWVALLGTLGLTLSMFAMTQNYFGPILSHLI